MRTTDFTRRNYTATDDCTCKLVCSGALILYLGIMTSLLSPPSHSFMISLINIFASDYFQWPCSEYGKWVMMGTPVHCGLEGTLHPPTERVDLYMDAVCHIQYATAHNRHINFLTVLPHINFQFHSVSQHTTCTYRLTWKVHKGTVTYWPPCTVTESRMFVHIMCNVW